MAPTPDLTDPSPDLQPGTYSPPQPNDLRSPCPAINALANHGYLPRSGRNVPASSFKAGMDLYGLSNPLGGILSYSIFYEHHPHAKSWTTPLTHPLQSLFGGVGMRSPHETDPKTGVPVLHLDQLAQHGIIEHDVSLSRRDFAQGDNISPQRDLIADILAASSDGKVLTIDDIVALRKSRYAMQKKDNPKLEFGSHQELLASAEAALILKVFGDGEKVDLGYVRAFFVDERLPVEEGWEKRKWWSVGLAETFTLAGKIKKMVGSEGEAK